MAESSFDLEMLLIVPFSIGAAASLGLIQTDIFPFIDLGEVLYQQGNIDLTAGRVIAALSVIAVVINRDASIRDTAGLDLWILYATLGMVFIPPFLPALEQTLAQQPAAIISFVVQGLGFTLISWSN